MFWTYFWVGLEAIALYEALKWLLGLIFSLKGRKNQEDITDIAEAAGFCADDF